MGKLPILFCLTLTTLVWASRLRSSPPCALRVYKASFLSPLKLWPMTHGVHPLVKFADAFRTLLSFVVWTRRGTRGFPTCAAPEGERRDQPAERARNPLVTVGIRVRDVARRVVLEEAAMVEAGEGVDHSERRESFLTGDVDDLAVLRETRRIVESLHNRQRRDEHGKVRTL